MGPGETDTLDPQRIEALASAALAQVPKFIWDGESLPIPVEDIVDSCFGLLVRDVEDMGSAPVPEALIDGDWISGLLLSSLAEIWVNAHDARRWPPRRRFTICHELGHWVLHRSGQQTLFCRAGHVDPVELGEPAKGAAARPPAEREADAFAAALLMPPVLLRRHRDLCDGDVSELCRRFDCSEKAMKRRLESL